MSKFLFVPGRASLFDLLLFGMRDWALFSFHCASPFKRAFFCKHVFLSSRSYRLLLTGTNVMNGRCSCSARALGVAAAECLLSHCIVLCCVLFVNYCRALFVASVCLKCPLSLSAASTINALISLVKAVSHHDITVATAVKLVHDACIAIM